MKGKGKVGSDLLESEGRLKYFEKIKIGFELLFSKKTKKAHN